MLLIVALVFGCSVVFCLILTIGRDIVGMPMNETVRAGLMPKLLNVHWQGVSDFGRHAHSGSDLPRD